VFQPGSLEVEQASAPLQNLAEDENTLIPLANMVRHIYIHHPKSSLLISLFRILGPLRSQRRRRLHRYKYTFYGLTKPYNINSNFFSQYRQ